MEYLTIPELPVLRGEKAVKALHNFIDELEKQRGKELTKKQTATLIKLAKGMAASIEAEKRSSTSNKDTQKKRSVHSLIRFRSFR